MLARIFKVGYLPIYILKPVRVNTAALVFIYKFLLKNKSCNQKVTSYPIQSCHFYGRGPVDSVTQRLQLYVNSLTSYLPQKPPQPCLVLWKLPAGGKWPCRFEAASLSPLAKAWGTFSNTVLPHSYSGITKGNGNSPCCAEHFWKLPDQLLPRRCPVSCTMIFIQYPISCKRDPVYPRMAIPLKLCFKLCCEVSLLTSGLPQSFFTDP